MKIQKAAQDYLESMLMMQQEHGFIRSVDIAEHLGVTKPSVTYTTKRLRENGYITMDVDGLITLTESGMEIATSMLDRHKTITKFLIALGVDPKTAEEDACKMEHDMSEQTYSAICRHARARMMQDVEIPPMEDEDGEGTGGETEGAEETTAAPAEGTEK